MVDINKYVELKNEGPHNFSWVHPPPTITNNRFPDAIFVHDLLDPGIVGILKIDEQFDLVFQLL